MLKGFIEHASFVWLLRVQALESGQLSGPVHSAFGVHLILRTETVNIPDAKVEEVPLEEEETDVPGGQ
jgi:hypothetical protein